MAGHSKWANIKHRKAAQDAKKGKAFTKAAKEIMLAARSGGGDPNMNPRLRTALAAARAVNLPKDKIDTAIKKGTGELQAEVLDEISYEAIIQGGVAIIIEVATDNKNRTVADVRHILNKNGGSMGESGCAAWMFERKGVIRFPLEGFTEDQLMEHSLEAGADDVISDEDGFEVHTAPENFSAVQQAFDDAGLEYESAELAMVPKNLMPVDKETGLKVMKLIDAVEEYEDVQNVYTNADFPEDLLEDMA